MVVNCLPHPPGLHSFAAALRTSDKVEGFGPEGLDGDAAGNQIHPGRWCFLQGQF